MAGKSFLVRAMVPLWYCPAEDVQLGQYGLTYGAQGKSGGKKYEKDEEFWVLEKYFSDYDTPREIERKVKDRNGNVVTKRETVRGSMRRVSQVEAPREVERVVEREEVTVPAAAAVEVEKRGPGRPRKSI